jgi:hypothetical protein
MAKVLHHPWVSSSRGSGKADKRFALGQRGPESGPIHPFYDRVWNPNTSPASLELHILRFVRYGGRFPAGTLGMTSQAVMTQSCV